MKTAVSILRLSAVDIINIGNLNKKSFSNEHFILFPFNSPTELISYRFFSPLFSAHTQHVGIFTLYLLAMFCVFYENKSKSSA